MKKIYLVLGIVEKKSYLCTCNEYHKQNTTAQAQINASQEVLKQATTAVNAVKDRAQLQQVWEQWTGKYQHLKDPNGVFFATVQAKSLTLK